MRTKSMYWAGPRCFIASMRHFDLEAIRILQDKFGWIVHFPLNLVSDAVKNNPNAQLFGKHGIIRNTCFEYVDKSDLVVAYTGLIWDTGTAREIERAVDLEKPILAWSDSSIVVGETLGRRGVIDGEDFNKLQVQTMPFNAMDVVFDKLLELSTLYTDGLTEEELAEEIDREATKLLEK